MPHGLWKIIIRGPILAVCILETIFQNFWDWLLRFARLLQNFSVEWILLNQLHTFSDYVLVISQSKQHQTDTGGTSLINFFNPLPKSPIFTCKVVFESMFSIEKRVVMHMISIESLLMNSVLRQFREMLINSVKRQRVSDSFEAQLQCRLIVIFESRIRSVHLRFRRNFAYSTGIFSSRHI